MTKTLVAPLAMALLSCATAEGGTASGAFKLQKGAAISPKHAVAYIVRDGANARRKQVEILLTDAPVDAQTLQGALAPHIAAINLDALQKRNYVLLWVATDGTVSMNATYSEGMKQFINDTTDGLRATLTTNTATKIEGRVTTAAPVKAMGGETYTVDLSFSVDVPPLVLGQPLPSGGGDAGKAFVAFLGVVKKKTWPGIKAAVTTELLSSFEASYRKDAENAAWALDMVTAWVPMTKTKVAAGELRGDTAILDVEGESFPGVLGLTLVRMTKAGTAWKVDQIQRIGFIQ